MEEKSTLFSSDIEQAISQEATMEHNMSKEGSPRQSTLERLRRFARAYHCTRECSIPAGIILN